MAASGVRETSIMPFALIGKKRGGLLLEYPERENYFASFQFFNVGACLEKKLSVIQKASNFTLLEEGVSLC